MIQTGFWRFSAAILTLSNSFASLADPLPTDLISIEGWSTAITVELARSQPQRERGLMFRPQLPANHGMLFIFPDQKLRAVWMKNTLISLDALFIDQRGYIVNILANLPPCKTEPCPVYESQTEAKYMLELPAGSSQQRQLAIGQKLNLPK